MRSRRSTPELASHEKRSAISSHGPSLISTVFVIALQASVCCPLEATAHGTCAEQLGSHCAYRSWAPDSGSHREASEMTRRLGVVMDPIAAITPHTDSTLAMLLEGSRRGWALEYMELRGLRLRNGCAEATSRPLEVRDQTMGWFTLGAPRDVPLSEIDLVLMRK